MGIGESVSEGLTESWLSRGSPGDLKKSHGTEGTALVKGWGEKATWDEAQTATGLMEGCGGERRSECGEIGPEEQTASVPDETFRQ